MPTTPVDIPGRAAPTAPSPVRLRPPDTGIRRGTAPPAAGTAPGWTRRPVPQALLLLALALAMRAPSFRRPFWSPDEGYLGTEAVALLHGGRMYADVVDRKPPLVPWLYEACFALTGPGTLWLVRVCAVVALAVTAVFVARLAAGEWGPWAGLPAGVLTIAASAALPAPDAMAATFEVFMLPATAAAVYFAARRCFLAAGLALAAATLTKQVGLAPLLPLAVQVLTSPQHCRLRYGATLAAGLALPITGCALLLGVRDFVFWNYLSSGSYAASPPGIAAVCGHARSILCRLAVAFAGFAPFLPRLLRRHRISAFDRTLWLWLLASAAGVSTGFRFYGHYFLQLVPPVALLALRAVHTARGHAGRGTVRPARWWALLQARGRAPARSRADACERAAAVACAVAVAVGAAFGAGALRVRPPEMGKSLEVAAAVDAESRPGQSVFLWSMHPEVYWLAGRSATSRYLTAGLLTNFSGGADVHRVGARYAVPGAWAGLRRELAAAPPCLVVDDSAGTPYRMAGYPLLEHLVSGRYTQVARVDGARIYRRSDC
ncbi:glycosyltransferase family 39 protein [Streptomyces sp. NPDC096013]|uniref:glycosyltransferase family 39 protein n=1 Tax=Streptomyces sp. NPDC096013 TaxID=3366069 RepID=UPI00381E06FA